MSLNWLDVQGFIGGSVNVPLYQPIDGWSPFNIARRAGYLAFGVLEGTEPNPDFIEGVLCAYFSPFQAFFFPHRAAKILSLCFTEL